MKKRLRKLSGRLRVLGYTSYARYLQSAHWRTLKTNWAPRYTREGIAACEGCYATVGLQLHHRTYKRLGAETAKDFHLVCASCHRRIHDDYQSHPQQLLHHSTKKILKAARRRAKRQRKKETNRRLAKNGGPVCDNAPPLGTNV